VYGVMVSGMRTDYSPVEQTVRTFCYLKNNEHTKGNEMKTKKMKTMTCLLVLITASVGWTKELRPCQTENANEVMLLSRDIGGYNGATYSFRFLTHDEGVTRNNWEIMFEAGYKYASESQDKFIVDTVVDDNSFIYDIGERSCANIYSSDSGDRIKRPLVWLGYSDAKPSAFAALKEAPVLQGHCYLTYNNDEDGRVVTLFHVRSREKNRSVTIDEIEVLDVTVKARN
jgi:hypothetical protein